jgi:hypothetical protein
VEKRTNTGVFSPTLDKKFAFYDVVSNALSAPYKPNKAKNDMGQSKHTVRLVTSFVHSK